MLTLQNPTMNKEILIEKLEQLGDLNAKTNPIVAGILFTLAGLCMTEEEHILASICKNIVDEKLQSHKN